MKRRDRLSPFTIGERVSIILAGVSAAGALLLAALPRNWIEEVTGVEPDGGNGLLELVPIVVLACTAIVLTWRVVRARQSRGDPSEHSRAAA
jgi:hypothetical protein